MPPPPENLGGPSHDRAKERTRPQGYRNCQKCAMHPDGRRAMNFLHATMYHVVTVRGRGASGEVRHFYSSITAAPIAHTQCTHVRASLHTSPGLRDLDPRPVDLLCICGCYLRGYVGSSPRPRVAHTWTPKLYTSLEFDIFPTDSAHIKTLAGGHPGASPC